MIGFSDVMTCFSSCEKDGEMLWKIIEVLVGGDVDEIRLGGAESPTCSLTQSSLCSTHFYQL